MNREKNMNLNKIEISGRLGSQGELKYTKNQLAILNFSIAQNDRQNNPMWFNVIVFDKQAEGLAPLLKKGLEVAVKGKIQIRTYTRPDGTQKMTVEIVADEVKNMALQGLTCKTNEVFNEISSSTTLTEMDIPF